MFSKNFIIRSILSVFIIQQVFLPSVCTAATLSEVQLINLETMQIATNSVISSLLVSGDIPSTPAQLNTSGYVENSGVTNFVTGSIAGVPISLDFTESSMGNVGTNISVTVDATGSYGQTSIFTEGTGVWNFDSTTNTYTSFNYTEHGTGQWQAILILIIIFTATSIGTESIPTVNGSSSEIIIPGLPSQNSPVTTNSTTSITSDGTNYYPRISGIINENATVTVSGPYTGTINIPEPSTFMLLLFLFGINLTFLSRTKKTAKKDMAINS